MRMRDFIGPDILSQAGRDRKLLAGQQIALLFCLGC
jgi:hypothetical protein